jgi:signal transduction histidine kinase
MTDQEKRSHAFAAPILDFLPDAIIWVRPVSGPHGTVEDFEIGYANQTSIEIINHPKGNLQGLHIRRDGVPSKDSAEANFRHFLHVYQTGAVSEYTFRTYPASREMETVRRIYQGGVLSIARNLSPLREAERKEQEKTQLLNGLVNHAPIGIVVYEAERDAAGAITDFSIKLFNDVIHRITGISKEERSILTFRQLMKILDTEPLFDRYKTTVETGEPFSLEFYNRRVKGWIQLSVAKLGDGFLSMLTDISQLKESQVQLESLITELKRSNQSLEEFAFAASHDLQEPLRKIYTFSDRLKQSLSGQLSAEQRSAFDRIETASLRMKALIDDLLTYAQVSAKTEPFQSVDLSKAVRAVLQDFETAIMETGAVVDCGQLGSVQGDERQLQQLFQNLIGNALKYRKPGVPPVVRIRCSKVRENEPLPVALPQPGKGSYFLIEVKDNGIGFEQEHAEKIFQIFQRLHGRAEYQGTGVGLAIVKRVADNHNGFVSASGMPGEGAVFHVLLPA